MKILPALISGFVGAATLTIAHQLLKKNISDAPEIDVLGMKAVSSSLEKAGLPVPEQERLYNITLASDLFFNTIYYAFTAAGKIPLLSGSVLGLSAGLGAISLPGPLNLGLEHSAKNFTTKSLSVGIYLLGGLAAAATYGSLKNKRFIE